MKLTKERIVAIEKCLNARWVLARVLSDALYEGVPKAVLEKEVGLSPIVVTRLIGEFRSS